jgi:hypothetical protein
MILFKYFATLAFLVFASLTCIVAWKGQAMIFASSFAADFDATFVWQPTIATGMIMQGSTTPKALPPTDRKDPSKPFVERTTDDNTTLITAARKNIEGSETPHTQALTATDRKDPSKPFFERTTDENTTLITAPRKIMEGSRTPQSLPASIPIGKIRQNPFLRGRPTIIP